jgi:C1A family cysteine protease
MSVERFTAGSRKNIVVDNKTMAFLYSTLTAPLRWIGLLGSEVQPVQSKYVYGWKRDTPSENDKRHAFGQTESASRCKWDLRRKCPPVYNQGKLGSCTANAIAGAFEFALLRDNMPDFKPARLFLYWNERRMEGHVDKDAGAEIRDGIQSLNTVGICPETMWPYDITNFATKPSDDCYAAAQFDRCIESKRVEQTLPQLRAAIHSNLPVSFGFNVYSSFESEEVAKTGEMAMPANAEQLLGGHAVLMVGYDDAKKCVIVRNSWGAEWGDAGYFYMPYAFLTDASQCSDFWTVRKVVDGYPLPASRTNK